MKHSLVKSVLSLAAMTMAASANAALITEWTYSVETDLTGAVFTSGGGTTFVSDEEISWGADGGSFNSAPNNRSAITLDLADASGTVQTNGLSVASGEINHWNNSIDASFATLTDADIMSTLTLTQLNPTGSEMVELSTQFMVEFTETFNGGTCLPSSVSVCDDIFVIDASSLVQSFIVDDYMYTIFIEPEGFGPLTNGQCQAAGASAGCAGFTTEEDLQNQAELRFRVVAEMITVPEPAALALFGMGLLGLGSLRRRS